MEEMNEVKSAPHTKLGRRKLLKIGAGAAVGAVLGQARLNAQQADTSPLTTDGRPTPLPPWGSLPLPPPGPTHRVARAGFKNISHRSFGNGQPDDIVQQVLDYANSFWSKPLSEAVINAANDAMFDSLGAIIAGFDSDPCRAAGRVAKKVAGIDLKSTVLGYGIVTCPEYATFANCTMVRHNDFNDNGLQGSHFSDAMPAIVAIAEAHHLSGMEVLKALTLTYELIAAFQGPPTSQGRTWDSPYVGPSACIGIGKLLKLNDDQLANAYSLSIMTHMAFNASHSSGVLSMLKSGHNADTVKGAVFAALTAQEGLTGPPAPFMGTKGIFDSVSNGPFKVQLPFPYDPNDSFRQPGQMAIEGIEAKRFPAEGRSQEILVMIPEMHKFAKPEEIASIAIQMTQFGEIGDAAKWDPQNEETADHSLAYIVVRGIMDGEIYLDSFERAKFTDPVARALMAKTTITEVPELKRSPTVTITRKDGLVYTAIPPKKLKLTPEELVAKFNRICDYQKVDPAQRDRMHQQWKNLDKVADMADAVKTAAVFGKPRPLSDYAPRN